MKSLTVVTGLMFIYLITACLPGMAMGENRAVGSPDRTSPGTAAWLLLSINEFMADNKSTLEDPDDPGSYEDWIEIYNPGDSSVDMAGMYLTGNLAKPTQWQIPEGVTIPPGGYLLIWADEDEEQGNRHANFKLSKKGEEIGLFYRDGVTLIDSITFDAQYTDTSYGRYPNAAAGWGFMRPTPGAANNPHNTPPQMSNTKAIPQSPAKSDQVWITSTVTDDGTVEVVTLIYEAGNGLQNAGVQSIRVYDDGSHHDGSAGDNCFGAQIPDLAQDTVVKYYLTATDNVGTSSSDPAQAPQVTFSYVVGYVPPRIFINEFMADSNATVTASSDGSDNEDWIELYNAGDSQVDLGGMYLTDDLTDPTQWQIPAGVIIPSGGYLLFRADGNNEEDGLHASFKLSKDGEAIGLFDTDARGNMAIDTVTFAGQTAGISYGRIYDGGEPWVSGEDPTPGSTNFFPVGRQYFFWKFPQSMDSYMLIRKLSGSLSAIERFNPVSGQWESACPVWDKHPSGVNFLIEPECKFRISINYPRSVCFTRDIFQ